MLNESGFFSFLYFAITNEENLTFFSKFKSYFSPYGTKTKNSTVIWLIIRKVTERRKTSNFVFWPRSVPNRLLS